MGELDGGESVKTVELFGYAITATSTPQLDNLVLPSRFVGHDDILEEEKVDSMKPNSLLFSNSIEKDNSLVVITHEEGSSSRTISIKGDSSEANGYKNGESSEANGSCRFVVANFYNDKNLENGYDSGEEHKVDSLRPNFLLCSSSMKRDDPLEPKANIVNLDCFRSLKKEEDHLPVEGGPPDIIGKTYDSKVYHGMNMEDNADLMASHSASVEKEESSEVTTFEGFLDDATNSKENSLKIRSIISITRNKICLANKDCTRCTNASAGKVAIPRSSRYHGVTRHRWSGKYEAHLWDSTCRLEGRRRKGKQVYLGSYDSEEKAARAYDIAALKYWGADTKLNFQVRNYEKELEDIKNMTREECVTYLRRSSCCFSRGASVYRGVTRRQKDGRWQARIGRVAGNKDIYLGTFKTEEEAAEAYDIAAIKLRGLNAVTNFHISNYCEKGTGQLEGEEGINDLDSSSTCKLKL